MILRVPLEGSWTSWDVHPRGAPSRHLELASPHSTRLTNARQILRSPLEADTLMRANAHLKLNDLALASRSRHLDARQRSTTP
jgi:hypothetical protein